jgi:Ca2+-dependent lipid-binding protein
MGIPKVSVACIPMIEKGINVLDLPMISNFVNASIATAANEYVAPKSMSMEIGKMLLGDDVKKETEALGVLWINIDKAIGLSKQDTQGSSDPYITIAFSKYGKPMYSTRVIVDDVNPVWRESTAILVRVEHIKAGESLSIELWDSDRLTADDMVGKVEVPIQDLMVNAGQMKNHVSSLIGEKSQSEMPGKLHWSVGFFGKSQFRPALRTSGKDVNLPPQLSDRPDLQDERGSVDTTHEDAVMHTPPDPLFPCGILSVIVHQIVNLELRNMAGTFGKRNGKEYSPGMKTGENTQESGGKLPSAYCTIILNDRLIYRTRTKVGTPLEMR